MRHIIKKQDSFLRVTKRVISLRGNVDEIFFSQLYAEVDTNYSITNTVFYKISNRIDKLHRSFKHYEKLFKGDEFSIVFVISATRENKELIKGPLTISKEITSYFSIFIPYKKFDLFSEQMSYILDYIAEGIIFVFNKYKTDPSGVKESIEKVKKLIADDPEKYQKWKT